MDQSVYRRFNIRFCVQNTLHERDLSSKFLFLSSSLAVVQNSPAVKKYGEANDGENLHPDVGQTAAF